MKKIVCGRRALYTRAPGHAKFLGMKSPTVFAYSGSSIAHISGPVVPKVPFWKNMARIATMARRPLANSAFSFRCRRAGIGFLTRHGGVQHPADLLPLGEREARVLDEAAEG